MNAQHHPEVPICFSTPEPKGLFGNFFWPGRIGQVDVHEVSFFTSVRPILSTNSRRQNRGVYPPGKGRPFGRIVARSSLLSKTNSS